MPSDDLKNVTSISGEQLIAAAKIGMLSQDDKELFSALIKVGVQDFFNAEVVRSSLRRAKTKLEKQRKSNAYFCFLNGGPKPYTQSGRLDWSVKEDYERIQPEIDRITQLEKEIENRVAGGWIDQEQIFRAFRLKTSQAELIVELNERKTNSLRTLMRVISSDDESLCLAWSGKHIKGANLQESLLEIVGDFEAKRLLSARTAEYAAIDYYRALACSVVDVSVGQLRTANQDWKDFDLLVDGDPIDVKNSRRSFSNPDTYVEHCVPAFKLARGSGQEVAVTGVLSDYLQVSQINNLPVSCRILGEVRVTEMRDLYRWMKKRFQTLVDFSGLWKAEYQPGWAFEYPKKHYPNRESQRKQALLLLQDYVALGYAPNKIPKWLFPVCSDFSYIQQLDLPKNVMAILEDLFSLDKEIGFRRPALFAYIVGKSLEALTNSDHPDDLYPILKELLFVPKDADSSVSIVGLEDSQGYIVRVIACLSRIHEEAIVQGLEFSAFKLTHPSILRGKKMNGDWMTLMAYCGGWIREPTTAKCGSSPLFFGLNEVCPTCGYLVCADCGFCSRDCAVVEERQRLVANEWQEQHGINEFET